MANKFLTDIELDAGLVDNNNVNGDAGDVLSSTGTGVEWIPQSSVVSTSDFMFYYVKNSTGVTISKGKGVMAVGTDGNSGHILVDEMVADGTVEARYFLGVMETDIANGEIKRAIAFGELDQFNTTGQNGETWAAGNVLWCDPDSPGDFTITEPDGPNVKIPAAFVLKASTQGKIQIRVQANEGIHQLHDTNIGTQADGEFLVWNNTTGVWFNDDTIISDYTNGRIGIGTTNPGNLLELQTQAGSGVTGDEGIFVKSPFAGATPVVGYKNPFISIGTTSDPYTTATATLYLGEAATATGQQSKIEYNASSNKLEIYGFGTTPLKHVEFGNPGSVTPRTVFYGDVGIGTTSPGEKLDVDGYIAANRFTDRDNASFYLEPITGASGQWKVQTPSGYVSIGPNNTSFAHFYTDMSNGYYFDKRIIADTGIFASYNEDLTLQAPYNTTRMTINSSTGNVGIGFTSTIYKLDVNGTFRTTGNNYFNNHSYVSQDKMINFNGFNEEYYIAGNSTDYTLEIGNGSLPGINPVIIIDGSLQVDLPTTPAATSDTDKFMVLDGTIVKYRTGAQVLSDIGAQASGSYVTTNTSQTISGSKTYSSTNTYQLGIDAYDGYGIYWGQSEYSVEIVADSGTPSLSIINNGNNVFHTDYTYRVGIGTTTPRAKLDVNGGVRIANDATAASATNVGTLRYRVASTGPGTFASYVDMVMQTGSTTYAWVNIVQNTW
jgi:hypothetical protein